MAAHRSDEWRFPIRANHAARLYRALIALILSARGLRVTFLPVSPPIGEALAADAL